MAVSPAILMDARNRRAELQARQDWWDSLIDGLERPRGGAMAVVDQYRKTQNDYLADAALNKQSAGQCRYCSQLAGSQEARLSSLFQKKGLPRETDLAKLYERQDKAEAEMDGIEGNLASFLNGKLSVNGKFLDRVDDLIRDGEHAKALRLVREYKPPFFSFDRWWMSDAKKTLYADDKATLAGKIMEHRKAAGSFDDAGETVERVEMETAKAIRKILQKDNGKLLDPTNPDVVAMAANPSVALLLRHAGSMGRWSALNPFSLNPVIGDLRRERGISMGSIQQALTVLESSYTSKYVTAKNAVKESDVKREACEDFIKSCRHAKRYETTAASGYGTRDDLGQALDEAIASAGTMSDKDMQTLIDRVKERQDRWAQAPQQADINANAAALNATGTFATHMLHQSAVPAFSRASHVVEHIKAAYHYVMT